MAVSKGDDTLSEAEWAKLVNEINVLMARAYSE